LHSNPACVIRHAIVVQPVLRAKHTIWHLPQLGAHQPLGVVEQFLDQRLQFACTVLLDHFEHAQLSYAARSDLRIQIAFAFARRAHIQQNQIEDLALYLASPHNAYRRDANPFLKNFGPRAHRSCKCAAHIRMMRTIRHVKRRLAALIHEDGQHHGDIRQVRSTCIWIIQNGDIARSKCNRSDHRLDRHRHRSKVHRHVIAHRDHSAAALKNRAGVVSPLFDVRRYSSAP
jgi:hypothetical protein